MTVIKPAVSISWPDLIEVIVMLVGLGVIIGVNIGRQITRRETD
jgi:hypothetical protein